jgi:hypothetical protein
MLKIDDKKEHLHYAKNKRNKAKIKSKVDEIKRSGLEIK